MEQQTNKHVYEFASSRLCNTISNLTNGSSYKLVICADSTHLGKFCSNLESSV